MGRGNGKAVSGLWCGHLVLLETEGRATKMQPTWVARFAASIKLYIQEQGIRGAALFQLGAGWARVLLAGS
jgi:hypothetical protein